MNAPSIPLLRKLPGLFYGVFAVGLAFSILAEGFFSTYNMMSLAKDCCVLIIVSIGMNLTILLGLINMSVGSVMSACGIVTGLCLHAGFDMASAIMIGLLVGALFGAAAGFLISYMRFDFWVVTYALMGIAQGVALILSNGNTVPGFDKTFRFLGDGKIFGIYFMIWLTAALCALFIFLTLRTKFGYNIYSIGGSVQSSRLSGINVRLSVFWVFVISGVLSAISGILLAAKSNSASPIGGAGYEFDAIAACLIGGTGFEGGKGKIAGTILGAVLMRMLRNGLNLLGLSPYLQIFIIGLIVMAIILADSFAEHRKKTQALRRIYKNEA